MSISVSIETQRNCSDSYPQSVRSSSTPDIPKENSFYSGTRSSAVIDGRITDDKLSFTIKWEKRFTWAYYSSYHAGWFCRTCQEYSNSHDQYWKTVPRTHDQHPGVFFSEHENCQKHVRAVTQKRNIKKFFVKGDIVRQISKGAESKTAKEIKNNRNLIKKFIKKIYFLAKKKWAVKNNFEETIEYLANLGVDQIFQHINNAPRNPTYISTFSAEQFLKAVGDFLSDQIITDLIAAGDFTILANESADKADRSQMSIRYALDNRPVERFLGILKLATSKKAADLHEIIMKYLVSKNLDSSCIHFQDLMVQKL